ncbi:MAG: hypothetical protein JO022_02575, partial [Acidobacteriaceae bacterium]|nr:hypothetical protein [Acidobacteriaceae bacterium]
SELTPVPQIRSDQLRFASEPGVEVGGKLYTPNGSGRKPAVLLIADQPQPVPLHVIKSPSTSALAQALVRAGRVVFEFQPRESPSDNDGRPFLGDWLANERADQIGRNLPAMRAHDILRAVDLLSARPDVDPQSIRAVARGVKGIWVLLAAAVDPRIQKVWLDRTPYSIQASLHAPLGLNLWDAAIPGFALHWDLQDLVTAMGDRQVFWTDPTNWMDAVMPLGPRYVYRTVRQEDDALIAQFLQ